MYFRTAKQRAQHVGAILCCRCLIVKISESKKVHNSCTELSPLMVYVAFMRVKTCTSFKEVYSVIKKLLRLEFITPMPTSRTSGS